MGKIKVKTKNLIKHYKRSFVISWKASPLLFCFRVFYELISVVIPIISLFFSRTIINILSSPSYDNKLYNFLFFIGLTIILQLVNSLLGKLNTYLATLHGDRISHQIDKEIIQQINKLDISYFDNPEFFDNMQNAIRDSGSLQSLTWTSLLMIKSIIQLISHLIIMTKLNLFIPGIIVLCCIPGVLADKYVAKRKYDWQLKRARNDRKLGYFKGILQGKGYAKDIRVFENQEYFKTRFVEMWREWYSEKKKMEKLRLTLSFACSILPLFSTTLVLISVGIGIVQGSNTLGDYSLYGGAATQLLASVTAFTGVITQSYESEMRLNKYSDFLKLEPLVLNTGKKTITEIDTVEFKDVCFTYPNTDRIVLDNVSFKICKNQSLALVGLNGAGKSTIVKLLLRLYDPDDGEILINGTNLKEYDIKSYHKCVGAVFQDFARYDLKIRETVALTDIDRAEENSNIVKACNNAELNVDIDALQNGIDTYLGKTFDPDGLELSGGNWQKIAIAQAFFKRSSLMLFDEPNSALDPEAERNLFEKMKQLGENKCVIYVTHRLSAATTANRILVIENGRSIEYGSHKKLMQLHGRYYDLFNKQAERYRDNNKVI